MIKTIETQVAYIPLNQIASDPADRFRLVDPKKCAQLKISLLKSGQTHPFLLEKTELEAYRLLDGHQRFEAICKIKDEGGSWEKAMGLIVQSDTTTLLDRFRLVWEKNSSDENRYGLYERSCCFKRFFQLGLSMKTISEVTGFSTHAVEDHIELSAIKPTLAEIVNTSSIEAMYALMLHHRYEAWIQTPYSSQASSIAQRVLDHAKKEKCTTKSWRFLLDFYWNKKRPFLSGRHPRS